MSGSGYRFEEHMHTLEAEHERDDDALGNEATYLPSGKVIGNTPIPACFAPKCGHAQHTGDEKYPVLCAKDDQYATKQDCVKCLTHLTKEQQHE